MLTFNAENPLHKDFRGPKRPTVKVPGINASDLNTTGQKSTRVRYGRIPKRKRPTMAARKAARKDAARKLLRAHGYNV